jgi:hypothetical protein
MNYHQNKLFAFFPECYNAPLELLSAKVPSGYVTEKIWEVALSNRIVDLALQERDSLASAEWACLALDCFLIENVHYLARVVFENNNEFKNFINCSIYDLDPDEYFPRIVSDHNYKALVAINNSTLFDWVLNVAYFVGGFTLESFLKYEDKYPN